MVPPVSVIVLNYNGEHLLPNCIESLKNQDYENFEIIVVDNGSTDNSKEVALSYRIKLLRLDKNYGLGTAFNKASKYAQGDFLFFVSNDMKFDKNCIKELMKVMEIDDKIFAVDPKQFNWEGTQVVHGKVELIGTKKFFSSLWPFIEYSPSGYSEKPVEVFQGCAGSLLVRKNIFWKLGGFDETFLWDVEDTDICWRAWLHHYKTVYVPSAFLFHKIGATIPAKKPKNASKEMTEWHKKRRMSFQKNRLRFFFKVMPLYMITLLLVRQILVGIGYLLKMDITSAKILLGAFWNVIMSLPEILKERQKIMRESITTSKELIKRFTA